jgi:lipopolysaccharide export system protein LptA
VTACLLVAFVAAAMPLRAQEAPDKRKLVKILRADAIRSMQYKGRKIDRLIGNVLLLHNDAYMSCDSAYQISGSEFEAYSRVEIIQEGTRLTGDFLHYDGAVNIAKVRGRIVRLFDSTATLRTQYLDFDTRENIGHFFHGGTIANQDSQIECEEGHYYSRGKRFVFTDSVEIKNDSYDIRCESGEYHTPTDVATFTGATSIWHKDGFLSCDYGWYDKQRDYFHFSKNAYVQSADQEIWADSIFYNRAAGTGDLYGHVQIHDSKQQALGFGQEGHFTETPRGAVLTRQPSVAYYSMEDNTPDTLFLRADTLRFVTELHPFYVKDTVTANSLDTAAAVPDTAGLSPLLTMASRGGTLAGDSLSMPTDTLGTLPADSTQLILADSIQITPADSTLLIPTDSTQITSADSTQAVSIQAETPLADTTGSATEEPIVAEPEGLPLPDSTSLAPTTDTLGSLPAGALPAADSTQASTADSLRTPAADTLVATPPDSTFRRLFAYYNVRAYRQDIQAACDSFAYSSLDSLGRMYVRPVLWNEEQQVSAEEIHFLTDQKNLLRADFLRAAFVVTHEQDSFYNQVKGRDITGHFRHNDLYLIEVFGNAQTLYYLREDSLVANGNVAESATMQIEVKNRKMQRIKYFSKPVSDTYPLHLLPADKVPLKGFEWREAERPKSRWEICRERPNPSRRQSVAELLRPTFPITQRIDSLH